MRFEIRHENQSTNALYADGVLMRFEASSFMECVAARQWKDALASLDRLRAQLGSTRRIAETMIYVMQGEPAQCGAV